VAAAQGTPAEAVIVRAHDGTLSSVDDPIATGEQASRRAVGGRALPISHGVRTAATVTRTPYPTSPAPAGTSSLWAAGDVGNGIGVTPV
jgi:hypothetical protein